MNVFAPKWNNSTFKPSLVAQSIPFSWPKMRSSRGNAGTSLLAVPLTRVIFTDNLRETHKWRIIPYKFVILTPRASIHKWRIFDKYTDRDNAALHINVSLYIITCCVSKGFFFKENITALIDRQPWHEYIGVFDYTMVLHATVGPD